MATLRNVAIGLARAARETDIAAARHCANNIDRVITLLDQSTIGVITN